MARIIAPKLPNGNNLKQGIGVSIPFSSPSVFTTTYTTPQQLKSNLRNYFLTEPGEHFLNVDFGFGLKSRLFEQLNNQTYESIQKIIQADVARLFPLVVVEQLRVFGEEDKNILYIELKYIVQPYNIQDALEITLQ